MSEMDPLLPSDVFTLFAPQPDPNDRSVANVPYELNGQPGVIDAEVQDDGYVQCAVRSGPARLAKWDAE